MRKPGTLSLKKIRPGKLWVQFFIDFFAELDHSKNTYDELTDWGNC